MQDKIDKYKAIVLGKKNPSKLQEEQMKKYRYAYGLLCEGYAPLNIANQLMQSEMDVLSLATAFRIVREAMLIFGNASKYNKQAMRAANYERLMKLAMLCEERGDFSTTRLLIKDANELLNLKEEDDDMFENSNDWMNPEAFVIITDPKSIDAAHRVIELDLQTEEVDFEALEDEEEQTTGNTDQSHISNS